MQQDLIFDTYYTCDMRPDRKDLEQFAKRSEISEHYGVSERTVIRWLKHYNMLDTNRLDMEKALEIRRKHLDGKSMKDLSQEYGVTFSSISRIIHKINYKEKAKDTAKVWVIHNPH